MSLSGLTIEKKASFPLILGANLVPTGGGMVRTVDYFRQSLGAEVVSLTHSSKQNEIIDSFLPATHLTPGSGLWGKTYLWPNKEGQKTFSLLAPKTSLLSVHNIFYAHTSLAYQAFRQFGTPYWIVPHGVLDPWVFTYRTFRKKLWFQLFGYRFFNQASRIIFATRREREKASHLIPVDDRSVVIPWPVAKHHLPNDTHQKARQEIRSTLGIKGKDKVLLFIGRLHEMKRPLETIQAVARTNRKDLHLIMIGPEETISHQLLRSTAKQHQFNNLHLPGKVFGDKKKEYMAAADAFILLSHRENFGHAVAEAISSGLPAILSEGVDLGPELDPTGAIWITSLTDSRKEDASLKEFLDLPFSQLQNKACAGQKWVEKELSFTQFKKSLRILGDEVIHASD